MSLTCDQAFEAAMISAETIKLDGELSPRKAFFFFLMMMMPRVCSHSKTEMCVEIRAVQRRSPSYHVSEVKDENLCFQDKTDHLTVCVKK